MMYGFMVYPPAELMAEVASGLSLRMYLPSNPKVEAANQLRSEQ